MKKILCLGVLVVMMCVGLTGCSIQLDDEDIKMFEKIKDSTNITINGNLVNTNDLNEVYNQYTGIYEEIPVDDDSNWNSEIYYENDDRVSWSYIDLGNNEYIVVYGYDENGNTTWTYETEKYIPTEKIVSTCLGYCDDGVFFVLDNGKIVALDNNDGNILWTFDDFFIANPYYNIDTGRLYVIYEDDQYNVRFLAIDKKGNILSAQNLSKDNSELANIEIHNFSTEFFDNEIIMMYYPDENSFEEYIINISLADYSLHIQNIEKQNVTKENLNGKTLISEYGKIYYFDEDGTFGEVDNMDYIDKYSVIRRFGKWNLKNDVLKLTITEEIVAEGGHYEYCDEIKILVDYTEKSIPINNDEYENQIIYYPNYKGQEMIRIDGELFTIEEPVG